MLVGSYLFSLLLQLIFLLLKLFLLLPGGHSLKTDRVGTNSYGGTLSALNFPFYLVIYLLFGLIISSCRD